MLSKSPHFMLLLDLKQGRTILYLVFEYMDANLKKFIHGHRITMRRSPTTQSRG
uniref:Protein kinase domain-containing protein n=1 Tax=Aegilops tauschii subsp. strangulata TaxID=200361 RepID=A0A453EQW5_AEGTS